MGFLQRNVRSWALRGGVAMLLFLTTIHTAAASSEAQSTHASSIIDHSKSTSTVSTSSPGTTTAAPQPITGDSENGRNLFIDKVKLANGGPACVSCHSIDTLGILGGGRLGPDLSNAVGIYGEEGLAETLADIPSMRTMGPIFSPHPLTPGEQADLVAFLISEADHPEPNKLVYILIASVVGFLAAIAIGAFYWRGRLGTVRADLVNRSRTGKQKP